MSDPGTGQPGVETASPRDEVDASTCHARGPLAAGTVHRLLWGRWRMPVVFLAVAAVYLVTSAPGMINDTDATAAAAWNLGTNGTLDFARVGVERIWWEAPSPSGGVYTDRFPGAFLPAVPLYAVMSSPAEVVDGVPAIPLAPAAMTAAFLVAGAVVVQVEVLRELVDERLALLAGLVAAFATPMWSIAGRALWTHTVGVFVLSLAMLALTRQRWWWAGWALGWAVLTRPTHAVTAAAIGILLAWSRRSWRVLVAIGVPSAVGLGSLSVYSHHYFGTWLPVAGYQVSRVAAILGAEEALLHEYDWGEQILGTFIHPYHGVIPYSLFLVPLSVGVVAGWRAAPDWVRAAMVAGAAYWLVQLRGNRFTGGFNFVGYRLPIEPLWLMMPVLVLGWVAWRQRSRAYRWVTEASVAVSIGLMVALVVTSPDGVRGEPRSDLVGGSSSSRSSSSEPSAPGVTGVAPTDPG